MREREKKMRDIDVCDIIIGHGDDKDILSFSYENLAFSLSYVLYYPLTISLWTCFGSKTHLGFLYSCLGYI